MASEIVTVLFTDLVGSTELLSRVGEERADGLRREAFDLSRRAIGANGGREVKNVGDGLMVVFGAPSAALNAAVVIQQALDTRNREMTEPLALRIGVSTGECNTQDGDFFGGAVIEAARLCGRADGGQIFVSGLVRTLAGTRGGHELAALGELELKGFDEPVDAYELRWQPAPVESLAVPLPARLVRAADTLFVGRAPECAALLQGLKEGAAAGRRRISFVSGEAGIGKTTLLCEFAHRAHEQGAVVLYGRCKEDLAVPYQPWREALAHVAQHAPELLQDDSGLLGSILGWAETERSSGDPASERYLLYATLVELLVRVSGRAPLVIVLEDLHWADGPSIALLRHLASSNAPLRLLLVGTLRDAELGPNDPLTDALAALHREDGVARLPLRGLGDVEVLALLERLAGHEMDANGVALRDALLSETDGNPFFMTEILRHLSETGAIYPDDSGRWLAGPNLREHGFPVSVREVIARRVARLGDNTRRALGYASVIGRDFDLEVLADVMDSDSDALLDLLEPAVQHTIVLDVAPGRFSFAHALIEHALYDELTPHAPCPCPRAGRRRTGGQTR